MAYSDDDGDWYYSSSRANSPPAMETTPQVKFGVMEKIDRPKVVVIISLPGAGKGTQCALLAKKYPKLYRHFSVGDYFRTERLKQTECGKRVQPQLEAGAAISDSMVMQELRPVLRETHAAGMVLLLDGFPRTAAQANALVAETQIVACIELVIQPALSAQRVANRWTDPVTNAVYSSRAHTDPVIAQRLIKRLNDDKPDKVEGRIRHYEASAPSIRYYLADVLQIVHGDAEIEDVAEQVEKCVKAARIVHHDFCVSCHMNVAMRINVPCAHCTYCENCVPQSVTACPIATCGVHITDMLHMAKGDDCYHSLSETKTSLSSLRNNDPESKEQPMTKTYYSKSGQPTTTTTSDPEGTKTIQLQAGLLRKPAKIGSTVSSLDVVLKVHINDGTHMLPFAVCAVVDVSGSMGFKTQVELTDGTTTNDNLTRLDYVKHALQGACATMNEFCHMSIVAFSSNAHVALPLMPMNTANLQKALAAISNLRANGDTATASGLKLGIDVLEKYSGPHKTILLFTDGEPTDSLSAIETLKKAIVEDPDINVCTFGLGSKLLQNYLSHIAELGAGTYSFMPDSGVVPACVSAVMGNIASRAVQRCRLQLTPKNGAYFAAGNNLALPDMHRTNTSISADGGMVVDLGPLRYGQSRSVIVPTLRVPTTTTVGSLTDPVPSYLEAHLFGPQNKLIRTLTINTTTTEICPDAAYLRCRYSLITLIKEAIARPSMAAVHMASLIDELERNKTAHPYIDLFLLGVCGEKPNGRIRKSFEKYSTWGREYIESVLSGHIQASKTNTVMDPDLNVYGGAINDAIEYKCRTIYANVEYGLHSSSSKPTSATKATDATETATSGGCLSGDVKVMVWNNVSNQAENRALRNVRAGDRVWNGTGFSTVQALVKLLGNFTLRSHSNECEPFITENHPIFFLTTREVTRMRNLRAMKQQRVAQVYNLILQSDHIVELFFNSGSRTNMACVTWGHDFAHPSLKHDFYGSSVNIQQALANVKQTKDGVFVVQGNIRNADGHTVAFL